MDTFTYDWGGEVNWVSPPLILDPLHHSTCCQNLHHGDISCACLAISPILPVLYPSGCESASFIKETVMLLKSQPVVLPGRSGGSLPLCDILAICFEFPTS